MFGLINLQKIGALRCMCLNSLRLHRGMCAQRGITMEYDRDPEPFFTDPEVQRLLTSITRMQLEKVFREKAVADNSIEYKFMTTEQLEVEFLQTIEKARKLLQMPPVVKCKEDRHQVISKDAALKDFSDTKFVFTDITYGLRSTERKIVVRQTDGTLEYAPQDVAKRMNQIYFPLPGRKLNVPRMFEEVHLERCLNEHKYEFILDRLTVQYDPYEREFHRLTSRVYQHVNENKQFDLLRSTRHFGPMAFFYAWHRCIDDLLYDMIQRDYLSNAVELIALMYKMHDVKDDYSDILERVQKLRSTVEPALLELRKSLKSSKDDIHEEIQSAIGKTREDFEADEICLKFIEKYTGEHALKKVQLELAVQTLKELNMEKKQLYDGLSKAHGIQQ